ncbi:unnamed protein product [Aphanomyces euteiches]|uniref:Protein kinase domain-containing protein n=1 Tax=Aphanomyces euteiches TaxID=100861 RepID=A0A6G0WVM4_9STRA|nr:hypothetical protein Ae201684_011153 [Aphanomyces euteiches]KAH9058701.1 hypothetical protein Ae201684P_006042 [Aphanomyces euteiches]KAH9140754.1 hypothetical protein AeRB84_015034 [Aphanomyces euteiches]
MELHMHVFEAKGLINKGSFLGKQSPYCTIKVAGQKFKTNVNIHGGCNPVFNQEFTIENVQRDHDFQIEVKGHRTNLPKTHLGVYGAKVELALNESLGQSKWYTLKNINKPNTDAGQLLMRMEYRSMAAARNTTTREGALASLPVRTTSVPTSNRGVQPSDKGFNHFNSAPRPLRPSSDSVGSSNGSARSGTSTGPRVRPTSRITLTRPPVRPSEVSANGASSPRSDEIDWTDYEELRPYRHFYIYPSTVTIIRQVNTDYMKTQLGHFGGEHVMVKSLKVPSERQTLIKEVIALSKVDCPKILAFVGFYIDPAAGGLHCITYHALANPPTLRELLNRMGPRLKFSEKLQFAIDVAEALEYMHAQLMMHRGIRAENVMLTKRRQAVLSGFGTCRDKSYDQTLTVGVGDIQWSAPEMLLDGEYAEKVDVYSFGVLLVEIETGKIPFEEVSKRMTRTELSNAIVTGKLRPSPSAGCPPPYKRVIDLCIQFDSQLRPTMSEVLDLLLEIQQNVPLNE